MPAYVPLTLQLKPDWVESFYRLLTDLSEGRIKEYKRHSPFAKVEEQVPIAKPKPKTLPNCIASYCSCGKCYNRVVREHKFPWKLADENKIFMAREGKSVTLCDALYAGLKENYKVGDLLGHVVKSSYEISNTQRKDEKVKQDEILDLKKRVDLRAERKSKGEVKTVSLTNQDLEHQVRRDKQLDIKRELDESKCQFCSKGSTRNCWIKEGDDEDDEGNLVDLESLVSKKSARGRDIEIVKQTWNDQLRRTDIEFKYLDHEDRCKLVHSLKHTQKELISNNNDSRKQQSSGADNKTRRDQPDMVSKLNNDKPGVLKRFTSSAKKASMPEWRSQQDREYY